MKFNFKEKKEMFVVGLAFGLFMTYGCSWYIIRNNDLKEQINNKKSNFED